MFVRYARAERGVHARERWAIFLQDRDTAVRSMIKNYVPGLSAAHFVSFSNFSCFGEGEEDA